MTDKTYWGLNEIEINKLFRLTDKYKNFPNVFLSLEVFLQPEEDYNYFYDKIKINYPDFSENKLFTLNGLIINFKEQNEYNEYNEFLNSTNNPIP
jgi:cobalamin biosynthesis Co2+ chelatase CbiK